ncbi:hypothetical protein K1T71_000133 [Dendrolimus kikuchii]|uniref:Uncharacterized protein n=1 Tax=Dendrolimus kikuchii TaxID=765133 RepID=A0ACC1DIM5_9NEOP|nr:hypothetical protein K1T71_000133 [Dendrolimus kikuchii]
MIVLKMFFLLLLTFCMRAVVGELNVTYVAIIYRHGERTPVAPYPTDPWRNESLWPVRFGELTNTGKRQHFALGRWLRQRYSQLLSDAFDPKEIYVRSTDVDRTLMSAQANLAGLFPPTGKSVWDTNLLWQPIPVHTVPEYEDEIVAMEKKCPAYNKEYERMIQSPEYKMRLSKYQDLMDYMTAYSGMEIKDYRDLVDIYSTLYIETLNNFTLPNWTHSVYPDKLKEPSCYSFTVQTGTPLLSKLKVGPLLKVIVANMNNTMLNTTYKEDNYLKMSMYSGHDLTVGNVLNAIGMFDGNCPDFTATILMELLFDNTTYAHYIRILYRNSTEIVEPYALRIPYCGAICPIDRFIKLYENLLTIDWNHDCKLKANYEIKFFPHIMGISFVISGFLVCFNLYFAPKPFEV